MAEKESVIDKLGWHGNFIGFGRKNTKLFYSFFLIIFKGKKSESLVYINNPLEYKFTYFFANVES